jgi:hypothetical protein
MATTTRYLRNKALMAKIEATYGVDPVPTGAANAILSQNDIKITGIQTDRKARDIIMSWMGNQTDIPVAARMMIEFDVEMAAPAAPWTWCPPGARCFVAAAMRPRRTPA